MSEHHDGRSEVDWVTASLAEVFSIRAGTSIPSAEIQPIASDEFRIPAYGGNGLRGYVDRSTHDGAFLVVGRAGALCGNVRRLDGEFFATEHALVLEPRVEVNLDWAFHALTKTRLNQYATRGAQPVIAAGRIGRVPFPLPPVNRQLATAQVLNSFSALEAELEAELEVELSARRLQYVHYRAAALDFDSIEVEWTRMDELVEVRSGWGFPNAEQGRDSGAYPFYKVSDMNAIGNETVMNVANHYIDAETVKKLGVKPAPSGTIIFPKIGAAVATNKKRVLSKASAYDNNVMGLVPGPRLASRFLLHWMQQVDLSSLAHNSGAVPSIRKSEVSELLVPVPDLNEQERIARALDKFDALVKDLSIGLTAELEARRDQYEYYRDKLLTFEELV